MLLDQTKIEEQQLEFKFPLPGSYSQGRKRNMLIFVVLNLVTLTHAFESTCLCVTLSAIAKELNASVSDTFGLTTSFLLCMTVAQPYFSEISWVAGRRTAFCLALALFGTGTIMCGCAKSSLVLLVGRAIQGAGAGGTEPVKALILFDLFDLRERSKWISYMNVSWALGTIAGPLLGGVFSENQSLTWRWIFWVNLPLVCVSFIGAAWLLGYDKPPKMSWKLLQWIDWKGLSLFTASGALILTSLSFAGSQYPWSSYQVITSLIIGLFFLVTLGLHEKVAAKPIFRPSVFWNWSTRIHLLNVLLHGLLMWVLLYYMSLFYLTLKDLSPLETAVWALPAIVTVAPMAMVVGYVVAKTGHYWTFLLCGWCLTTASFLALGFVTVETSQAALIGISVAAGISFGALVPGMSVGIQATVNKEDAGHAICMTLLMRPAGQALGIAIGLTVFATIFNDRLASYGISESDSSEIMKELASHSSVDILSDKKLVDATINGLQGVWIMGSVVAGLGMVLSTVAKCPRLPPDRKTDELGEELRTGTGNTDGAGDADDEGAIEMMSSETWRNNRGSQDEPPGYTSGSEGSDLGRRPAPTRGFTVVRTRGSRPLRSLSPVVVRLGEGERRAWDHE